MKVRAFSFVRPETVNDEPPARIATIAGTVSALFRRSLAVRVAEQRTRIERTGLAGMI